MSWKDFIKKNWKSIILFTFLVLIIPNIISFVGSYTNDILFPRDYTKFNFLAIEFGGPPFWVVMLSNISLILTAIILTLYFLKKKISLKDISKIVLTSAIFFSIINFVRFLISVSIDPITGGLIPYFSSMGTTLSYDLVRGLTDIISFIFYRLIYTPLFYIIIPCAIVLAFQKYRNKV